MADVTPVTLLTGVAGAGRTTLLNRLLRDPALARTAVLADRRAAASITHALVRPLAAVSTPFPNGCVCCAPRDDMTRVLRQLLPRARRGEIDRVVIQLGASAHPLSTLTALMRDPAVAAAYAPRAIVAMVDADADVDAGADAGAGPGLTLSDTTARQVAMADRVLVNRAGAAAQARLRGLNPLAPLIDIAAGAIDAAALIDGCGPLAAIPCAEAAGARLLTTTLAWMQPMDAADLSARLHDLAARLGGGLLRLRGLVWLRDARHPAEVHAAGHLVGRLHPLSADPGGCDRYSRLVLVTEAVAAPAVRAAIAAAGLPTDDGYGAGDGATAAAMDRISRSPAAATA
ncbi:GTP-binding protein [Rhodopila sp.]|uniref:GTP-binding protein n=1 Tax=Rhodopila sp. TaxID=2480087 RepID=UPI002CD09A5D|nr:GTP-binding protein [Rhodopila sp.]HVZ07042.1 GTP-binding protein [Rhodopila sp.]